jgi:putative hydrolase of HD superfamily
MRTKAAPPATAAAPASPDAPPRSPLLEAYLELNQLKHLYRQGWLRVGVAPERCESVAEHSFFVALLCLFLADAHFPALDRGRLLRMALLHDAAEARVGDVTPHDGVTREEKHRREREAARALLLGLPRGEEYLALWEEYEAGQTPEARLVKEVDRLEMGLQARVYALQGAAGDLSEFVASAERALSSPGLRALLDEAAALRPPP